MQTDNSGRAVTDEGVVSARLEVARLVARKILDLVLPPACVGCDALGDSWLCPGCARSLPPRLEPSVLKGVPLYSAYAYTSVVGKAVERLKYRGRSDLAAPLGQLMASRWSPSESSAFDLIVPVPMHPRRLAERGYNQSFLLARELGRTLGIACETRALVRVRDTPQQAGLGRAERRENVRGAFAVCRPELVRTGRVLIVDDVVTTGSTALGCADVLKLADARVLGIGSVCAATAHPAGSPIGPEAG